jgi:REP element-mobilizing transposase RayT
MSFELVKSSHSAGESGFHLQFTPAYRRAIFARLKVMSLVRAYLLVKTEEMRVTVKALEFGPDHIHIFVAECRKYSASQLAMHLKGFVARMMRKNHKKLFCDMLWGDKFWSGGYFYRSIGSVTSEAIKYYIEHSQAKHWREPQGLSPE